MRLILAALFLSAPLYGQLCDFTVAPTTVAVPAPASTGQISVTTQPGCGWNAVVNNNFPWLHITSGLGYNSSGNASYSVDANVSAFVRSGTMTIAGKTITVNQAAATCNFDIAPKSQNFAVGGGTGSFNVTANCAWQASSNNNSFITVPNDPPHTTDGTVTVTVAANGCVAGRGGTVTVNTGLATPPVFTVTQDGSPANLTLSATSATAGPDASDGRITVTTGLGCGWSASSDVSWMTITSGSSGSGNGFIAYHLLANTTAARTGTIHVGNLTYTVTQSAAVSPAPTLASVNSAANYRTDAVSPGEIVTLFGSKMGPTALVPLQVNNGVVTNTLAGTQVLFDNVAAPLIYTRQDQVSAIVPYGVAGKTSTQVQVVYNGAKSNIMTMPVQATHPGIFTQDVSGTGPGAILNQDTNLNSNANPAARGTIVAIYATGGGTTNPPLADGAVTGATLPYLTQTTTVTIGGIEARVTYAGGVPGAVAGLTQINAEVPTGVPAGPAQVIVKIGNFTSSLNVTLAVR